MKQTRNHPDYQEVARAALASVDSVLNHFLPSGQRQGREYIAINPTRSDSNPGSFSINLDTGKWSDFATGDKGSDLVSLVAYLTGAKNQGEGKETLAQYLGIAEDTCFSGVPRVPRVPVRVKCIKSSTSDIGTPEHLVDDEVFQVFQPVPADAPPPPESHPTLGIPSMKWVYRTPQGEVIFFVYRFEAPRGKEFRPLTFQSGRWTWKGLPGLRPLYNLHLLAGYPEATVIVTEGEKAAEAAAIIFPLPDFVTTTWPNGAKASEKADFSPLAGCKAWLWADNDVEGRTAMDAVTERLKKVGAADVRDIQLSFFNRKPSDLDTIMRETLPPKWDAADALMEGFSSEDLAGFLGDPANLSFPHKEQEQAAVEDENEQQKTEPLAKPITKIYTDGNTYAIIESKKGYRDGVYFFGRNADGTPCDPRWICSILRITAETRDTEQSRWGWLLQWKDPDGHDHQWACPKRLTQGDGIELCKELTDRGVGIPPGIKAREHVIKYLCFANPKTRLRCTETIGWHKGAFVLPNQTIVGDNTSAEQVIFQAEFVGVSTFSAAGTLQDWRDNVSAPCRGNSRLIFAVSISFAGVLLEITGSESGGVHLVGESSIGKTTAQSCAASVWATQAFKKAWNATINGLEGIAAAHNDTILILDELSQSDPKTAGETAYMLANGQGKGRAGRSGNARKRQTWRLMFLSSGESDLASHIQDVGKKARAGQEVRLLNITSDAGKGHGLFEELHGLAGGKELADRIKESVQKYYGTAGPAFISKIIENADILKDKIRLLTNEFVSSHVESGTSGQVFRAAERFGLIAVAGELATAFGITGWQPGESERAADICFKAWVDRRGGTENHEATAILAQVRAHFEMHGEGRYVDVKSYHGYAEFTEDKTRDTRRAGFREKVQTDESDIWNYYVLPQVFKTELCKGFEQKTVTSTLKEKGILHPGEKGKMAQSKHLPGMGKTRCYVISGEALFGEAE